MKTLFPPFLSLFLGLKIAILLATSIRSTHAQGREELVAIRTPIATLDRNYRAIPIKEEKQQEEEVEGWKADDTATTLTSTSRATTYSSLLTLNLSNTIIVALVAAAGAFYYGGVPLLSIRRSINGIWDRWDRWDAGLSDMWQSGLMQLWDGGLRDAIQSLTPVVQEALRVYNENQQQQQSL